MFKKLFVSFMFFMLLVTPAIRAQLSERAPDVLPGTLPEMRNPSYWIDRMDKPDDVILTPDRIDRMNRRYREKVSSPDFFNSIPEGRKSKLQHYFPGIALWVPDLRPLSPAAVADTVRRYIAIEIEYMRSRDFGNTNEVKYAAWEIDELEGEMAVDKIGKTVAIREGIAVRTSHLKNVPAFSPEKIGLVKQKARMRLGLWDIGILKIGKPVVVLHPSKSGEFVFVQCEIGYGWVRSENVAFGTKEEIGGYINAKDFVICTGDREFFYSDESCIYSSGWFRMGDRLPLASKGNPRLVRLPVRRMNGTFATETAWLAKDADVSIGYLPYSRRNIVKTAFKLLDNAYDFTGTFFGRQHETTYRDIFSCFGFDFPFHGGLFTHYGDNEFVLDPEIGREGQYRRILEFEPFITVMITFQDTGGHAQLLLGDYEGVPIVFDQHGYGYTDENGKELMIRRCCVGEITSPAYFLKRKLTFLELK